MTVLGKLATVSAGLLLVSTAVEADVYMHNPRGSNNRNARNDNNTNRRNGNRLFDSQNNDKGGYSAPRAYPFACYDNQCNNGAQANIQNPAGGGAGGNGILTYNGNNQNEQQLQNTPVQYYYAGSIISLEFSAQHGLGDNPKLTSEAIIQYTCEDVQPLMRDGIPVRNNGGNNKLDEASDTIPRNQNAQNDYGYGRHETLEYYNRCRERSRNQGLYIADQDLNGNSAIYSRQNPNGNRNGLECPEESEYYPYWGESPYKDIALVTSQASDCAKLAQSQNVVPKYECVAANENTFSPNNPAPLTQTACTQAGGVWTTFPAYNLPPPSCWVGPKSRVNHLGNAGGVATFVSGDQSKVTVGGNNAETMVINFTVPDDMVNKGNCHIRLRYNMSTIDTAGLTAADNLNPLLADRNEREELSYQSVYGLSDGQKVGMAVNTNQNARTFQDRSHVFTVKAAPTAAQNANCGGKLIHNLNLRGKRGNIVQTYPSVEYDFVPAQVDLQTEDCVHVQFVGSDYNPNRNPNNGEGGPSNPNNDNEAKSDRSNLVPMQTEGSSYISESVRLNQFANIPKPFAEDVSTYQKLAMLDQAVGGCETIDQLQQRIGGNNAANREARERYHTNCGKLSAQKQPLFDGGLLKAGAPGNYQFINTRNNNLSNRSQKGVITVTQPASPNPAGAIPGTFLNGGLSVGGSDSPNGGGGSSGVAVGVGVGAGVLAAVGAAFVAYRKMNSEAAPAAAAGTVAAASGKTVTARHAHNAKEAGELSFAKGEQITVLRQDGSGWWEGQLANGSRGVFPSNYVQ